MWISTFCAFYQPEANLLRNRWHDSPSLLRTGLFVSWGRWGERKRKHAGHDGKGKDRRQASAILAIVEGTGASFKFKIIDKLTLPFKRSCWDWLFDQVWCSKVEQGSSYDSWNMVKDPYKRLFLQGSKLKKSSGRLLANNRRNIVARCKFLVASL